MANPLENLLTEHEFLAEWFQEYDKFRAQAEVQDDVLSTQHAALEVPEEVPEESRCPSRLPDVGDVRKVWDVLMPENMVGHFGPRKMHDLEFTKDVETTPKTLAVAMDDLRDRIDGAFGWRQKVLDSTWQTKRGGVQAVLLLLEVPSDDSKSEILQTKLFTLLLGERYRAHGDVLFTYSQGAWQTANSNSVTAEDLDFLSLCLRRCQMYFLALGRNNVNRKYEAVVWDLRVILAMPTDDPLLKWQLCDVSTQKAELRTKYWWLGLSELARDLRKALADHSKNLVRSFLRWSDSNMSTKRKAGIAFEDCADLRKNCSL